jgi:hypothetical protein
MRKIGALLYAECYSPSELDMTDVRKVSSGEFNPTDQSKVVMQQQVVGDILKHYYTLNPDRVPTIGFGPDVRSSIWLCDHFNAAGIKAAHIDGENVYLGEHDLQGNSIVHKSSQAMRDQVFDDVRSGRIKVVWNRFVMREGIDIPELGHAIFACAFGAPESWLQAVGRILRAHPSLSTVCVQDHGGNCCRAGLGSPNQDREWTLAGTNKSIVDRAKSEQKKSGEEPSVRCPGCCLEIARSNWIAAGNQCPICGHTFQKTSRMVLQSDGSLRKVVRKQPKKGPSDPQKLWTSSLYQFGSSGKRYSQVSRFFKNRTGQWPNEAGVVPVCKTGQVHMLIEDIWPEYNRKKQSV